MYMLTLTTIAIIGAFAVAKGKAFTANVLWLMSNPLMGLYNYRKGELELAVMFGIYSLIAVYGVWNLKLRAIVSKVIDKGDLK